MSYPTIVVDDFFDNVEEVITFSQASNMPYRRRNVEEPWPGERSCSLKLNYDDFSRDVYRRLIKNFPDELQRNFSYDSFELFFSKIIPGDFGKSWYHCDSSVHIASVIYLSDGDIDSGTTVLDYNYRKQTIVSNKKNTAILYDARKIHAPTCQNYTKERITLLGFFGHKDIIYE